MPRKKEKTEAELLEEKERIEAQLKTVREKENTELGKSVKRIFGDYLPKSNDGRQAFLKELKAMLDEKAGVSKEEPETKEKVETIQQSVSENKSPAVENAVSEEKSDGSTENVNPGSEPNNDEVSEAASDDVSVVEPDGSEKAGE